MTEAAAHADDHPHVNYMAKFWWLLGLTLAEVGAAVLFHQKWPEAQVPKLIVLGAFAIWKAGIVLNYFMHLKEENRALKLAVSFPLVLIIILFLAFITDSHWLHYAQGY